MEVLAERGPSNAVHHLADCRVTAKGVRYGKLKVITTDLHVE